MSRSAANSSHIPSDTSGNLYRRDLQVTAGPNGFTAPVPLSKIDDIGGVLYVGTSTYGCSVAPQRPE